MIADDDEIMICRGGAAGRRALARYCSTPIVVGENSIGIRLA